MVTINVMSDFIDDVQAIIDVCDGEGRSIECRSLVVLARKLLGAIKQTNRSEFAIELIEVESEEVVVEEGEVTNETIQSTEDADEHLEKNGEEVIEDSDNSDNSEDSDNSKETKKQ